jgi:hypothetical protein
MFKKKAKLGCAEELEQIRLAKTDKRADILRICFQTDRRIKAIIISIIAVIIIFLCFLHQDLFSVGLTYFARKFL